MVSIKKNASFQLALVAPSPLRHNCAGRGRASRRCFAALIMSGFTPFGRQLLTRTDR
jgi:hypothetical protein